MRLVACPTCHTQYDVGDVSAKTIPCRCGASVDTAPQRAVDAAVARCSSCGAGVSSDDAVCSYCASPIVRDPASLSLICPECFARSAEDARFCTACGVAFRPEPVRIDGHELPCPVCSALMPPRQLGGVGLNECATCHGLWVPGDGFDALVARAIELRRSATPAELLVRKPRVTGSNPAAQTLQYRKCPECDAFMQRRNYRRRSGIIVDRCAAHGTWLDADELEQIAGFILSGAAGADVSPEREARERLDAQAAAALARIQARHASHRRREIDSDDIVDSVFGLLSAIFK